MDDDGPGVSEVEALAVAEQPVRHPGHVVALPDQEVLPEQRLLHGESVLVDEGPDVAEGRGVEPVHPEPGIGEQAVVQDMVLVGVARDEDVHLPLVPEGDQLFPVAGCVDEDAPPVVHRHGVAVRVPAAPDEPYPASDEIEHVHPALRS